MKIMLANCCHKILDNTKTAYQQHHMKCCHVHIAKTIRSMVLQTGNQTKGETQAKTPDSPQYKHTLQN
jgi:hypothetical protein